MRTVTYLFPVLMVVGMPAFAAPAAEPVVAVAQARQLTPGLLVSGQPTPEALEQAKARGFRTVINLRAPGEAGAWEEGPKALSLGLRYLALPIPNAEALTEENARRLAAVLNDPESAPVLLHCATGNRAGALLALKAGLVDGLPASAAIALGRDAGMTKPALEAAVRSRLGAAAKTEQAGR